MRPRTIRESDPVGDHIVDPGRTRTGHEREPGNLYVRRPPGKNAGPCAIVIAAQIDQQVNTVGRDPARRPNIVITSQSDHSVGASQHPLPDFAAVVR